MIATVLFVIVMALVITGIEYAVRRGWWRDG